MKTKIKEPLPLKNEEWYFPNSVHDTFEALYAIASHNKKLLEGKPLGRIAALLMSVESRPGGPYYSQFPKTFRKAVKGTIDKRTNQSIGRFLSLYDIELPQLGKFFEKEKTKKTIRGATKKKPDSTAERSMMRKIHALIKVRFSSLDAEFRKSAENAVEKTILGNPDKQMALMPYYMKMALGKKAYRVSKKTVADMCVANIFFWTAFVIYDDFWDEDEEADPKLLPVANLLARSYIDLFGSLCGAKGDFNSFFHKLMDELDTANAWETSHCRARIQGNILEIPIPLPRYGNYINKYRPPSGHIMGPLAVLVMSGYKIDSKEAVFLIEYFKHYLIAMQMNDDMHDWEEDIRRGHISTVVDMLLRDFGVHRKTINLETDMEELRHIFWFTTLPKIAQKALNHTKKSEAALLLMKSLSDRASLEYFIYSNQKIAEKALKEQHQSVQFLNAYGKLSARRAKN
ncbi:MAG TPA: hypothetical protein VGO63_03085 [Candidatus Paceibacterota bacterium]|jgi:hypothetical protein|nr:hypothetical protein [Candidatus Paceibacterota bacterium]